MGVSGSCSVGFVAHPGKSAEKLMTGDVLCETERGDTVWVIRSTSVVLARVSAAPGVVCVVAASVAGVTVRGKIMLCLGSLGEIRVLACTGVVCNCLVLAVKGVFLILPILWRMRTW